MSREELGPSTSKLSCAVHCGRYRRVVNSCSVFWPDTAMFTPHPIEVERLARSTSPRKRRSTVGDPENQGGGGVCRAPFALGGGVCRQRRVGRWRRCEETCGKVGSSSRWLYEAVSQLDSRAGRIGNDRTDRCVRGSTKPVWAPVQHESTYDMERGGLGSIVATRRGSSSIVAATSNPRLGHDMREVRSGWKVVRLKCRAIRPWIGLIAVCGCLRCSVVTSRRS